MCGVYTDNQPDFSWIQPFEEKTFSQYFMPYRDLGVVKNATKEAMLNLEFDNNTALIKCYTLGVYPNAKVELKAKGNVVFEDTINANPRNSFKKQITLADRLPISDYTLTLYDASGKVLVDYTPKIIGNRKIPDSAKAAKFPEDIHSIEQLYLTGLHLEQYRHATYNAQDYYLEGLKRESGDIRCNNAMGLLLLRKGQFKKAEQYFNKAILTSIEKNPNPYDGEPYYNLGQSLKYQGEYDAAYAAFYKSAWNAAWQDAAYFHLAQITTLKQDYKLALELVEKSLLRNGHNHKARVLKIALLRKAQKEDQALILALESLDIDGFNFGALYENYILTSNSEILERLKVLMRNNIQNYIEYALDYDSAGLFEEAITLLNIGIEICTSNAMAYYFLGWFTFQNGNKKEAKSVFEKAKTITTDYCFAYRLEAVTALECALKHSDDPKAYYHLGNLWYDKKQYKEAINCWEKSRTLDPGFPTVHRNLALAYFNKKQDDKGALTALETAFSLDTSDSRILFELDCLYKRLNYSLNKRLDLFSTHKGLVDFRDDLYLEQSTLYNLLGNSKKALGLLENRQFHPWEGGEGKVTEQYVSALIALAKEEITNGNYKKAIAFLEKTEKYPENLGEGKLTGVQENDIHYWLACAYEGLEDKDKRTFYFNKAAVGLAQPEAAVFYNDKQPDKIFYQGLAYLKLGKTDDALIRFNNLVHYGKAHINDAIKMDYFAVSLPDLLIWEDDLDKRNKIHCLYLIGLGYIGLGCFEGAEQAFNNVLDMDNSHLGVQVHLEMLRSLELKKIIKITPVC